MLSILDNVFRLASLQGRWEAPDHWRKRGPKSDWEIANDEWERNRRLYKHPPMR